MALHFAARIHALTGFDADSTVDTDTGQDFDEHAAQWMTEAAKEVIEFFPPNLLERCGKISSSVAEYTDGTGVETENKVISVTRTSSTFNNSKDIFVCRQIPHTLSYKASDPDSMEYATPTDPVWYYDHASGGDNTVLLKVLPTSDSQVAKVTSVDYPVFTAGDTETYDVAQKTIIANFPDEAEHLVVTRAAISALEYQAAIEEDLELYLPIIQNLRQDYMQGLQAIGAMQAQAQPQQAGR
jgi:hypothetical protein